MSRDGDSAFNKKTETVTLRCTDRHLSWCLDKKPLFGKKEDTYHLHECSLLREQKQSLRMRVTSSHRHKDILFMFDDEVLAEECLLIISELVEKSKAREQSDQSEREVRKVLENLVKTNVKTNKQLRALNMIL